MRRMPRLLAAKTARRAEELGAARLVERSGLVGCGRQGGSRAGEILFLEDKRTLQDHFYLRPVGDIHIGAAGEERNQARGSKPCADSGNSACKWMAVAETADGANGGAGWDGDLGCFACVAPFVGILLDGSFAVVLRCLFVGSGKAVDDPGNLDA